MAKIVVAGCSDCPYFAKVELLADNLKINVPNFHVHKIVKTRKEWSAWSSELTKANNWNIKESPIIWRELVDRGGKGHLIGGANEFQEYVKCYYNIISDFTSQHMQDIALDNIKFKEDEDREIREFKALSTPTKVAIVGAMNESVPHFVISLSRGDVINTSTELALVFLDKTTNLSILKSLQMGTFDLAYPLVRSISITDNAEAALADSSIVVIFDERTEAPEESEQLNDWMKANQEYYEFIGNVIDKYCLFDVKVVLVPTKPVSFVNIHLTSMHRMLQRISKFNVVGLSRGIEQHVRSVVAKKLSVNPSNVHNNIVWGNIGGKTFHDVSNSRVHQYDGSVMGPEPFSLAVEKTIWDKKWMKNEMNELIVKRFQEISDLNKGFGSPLALATMESKVILFVICISWISVGINCEYASETIKQTQGVLAASKDVFGNMAELITSANPGKLFSKLSGILGSLGPAAMAISAVLSIVTMFLPKEDSPELKAIKAGFEKVNNKLDIITSKIGSLENIIELSSARAAYVKTVTSINNNFEAYSEATKTQSKESFDYFAKQYENSFEFATANMFDAMTGSTGPFGFNMVNLYKTHVKCNPSLLSQFCTMGMHLINKGLAIEGAYLGYMNFTAKAKGKAETWKGKLQEVGKQCSAVIESCESSWKDYAYQQFRETHREIGGDNQAFAERVARDLANVVPQRNWLAVIYNDAGGFGPHTYSSYYEAHTIWNEKDHDTTIFSTPKEEKLTGDAYNNLVNLINGQKNAIARVDDCQKTEFWLIKVDRYKNEDARTIVTKIREKYMTGVVYAIKMDYHPGQAVTGGTLYATDQKWQCTSQPFRLIIFQ